MFSKFPFPPTRLCILGAVLLSCLVGLSGCVSNKYQAASALGAQPQRMDFDLGGTPMKTRLDAVIIYQGPGSWKKSAYWDEFICNPDQRV